MTEEVRSLRPEHNFAPDSAIADVARALRQNVDAAALDGVLAALPEGAAEFWSPRATADASSSGRLGATVPSR
ncbi:MAG TPA: hypothetical protein VMG32_12055 [Anaeromyxobacteraceae bacterium]|nr:hypothetical protein [Anaeromyxobacteraceae bacterium]